MLGRAFPHNQQRSHYPSWNWPLSALSLLPPSGNTHRGPGRTAAALRDGQGELGDTGEPRLKTSLGPDHAVGRGGPSAGMPEDTDAALADKSVGKYGLAVRPERVTSPPWLGSCRCETGAMRRAQAPSPTTQGPRCAGNGKPARAPGAASSALARPSQRQLSPVLAERRLKDFCALEAARTAQGHFGFAYVISEGCELW